MNTGKVIKEIRTEKGISQGDLATACNISQAYLSQVENAVKIPSITLVNVISKQLGIPTSVIYYLAIEDSDVPQNKKGAYGLLSSTIESLIKSVYL